MICYKTFVTLTSSLLIFQDILIRIIENVYLPVFQLQRSSSKKTSKSRSDENRPPTPSNITSTPGSVSVDDRTVTELSKADLRNILERMKDPR